jgi:hypothetical protein
VISINLLTVEEGALLKGWAAEWEGAYLRVGMLFGGRPTLTVGLLIRKGPSLTVGLLLG